MNKFNMHQRHLKDIQFSLKRNARKVNWKIKNADNQKTKRFISGLKCL